MSDFAVEARSLTKERNGRLVVDGVDLVVPTGAVFAILGPTGSGRTTLLRLLLGLVRPTAGNVRLLGRPVPADLEDVLPRIGASVGAPGFHEHRTGRQNLEHLAAVSPSRGDLDIDETLRRTGLVRWAERRVGTWSPGTQRRLALAAALLRPRPRLLVLDDPTDGLDPLGAQAIRRILQRVNDEGTTVLFTSSDPTAAELTTHTALLRQGRVVLAGATEELRLSSRNRLRVGTPDVQVAHEALVRLVGTNNAIAEHRPDGDGWVDVELNGVAADQVAVALVHANVRVRSIGETLPTMTETYVSRTGESSDAPE